MGEPSHVLYLQTCRKASVSSWTLNGDEPKLDHTHRRLEHEVGNPAAPMSVGLLAAAMMAPTRSLSGDTRGSAAVIGARAGMRLY